MDRYNGELSDQVDALDILTEMLSEIRNQDLEMIRAKDEIETHEKLQNIKFEHPLVYTAFQMIDRGEVDYEHGLEKLVLSLVEENKRLKEELEHRILTENNPLGIG